MREYSLERKRVHSEDYEDQVRQIPSSVTFITPCCSVKKRLVGIGIEPNRIRVRKFGIPSDAVFRPRPARREGVTVLYLGRLADCKGPDLVIRAFEMACDRGLSGNLIVAGDGPLNVACQLIVDRSKWRDRVTLLGAVDAQTGEKLRRSADVFTAHSCRGPITNQEEAAGIAFLEAMGSGLPVVTGRSGGITEYIVDGDNGLFFEPGDVETHADLLLRLANDPAMRSEIGRRAWETVKTDYPLENDSVEFPKILGL
ncbi:MAG TPA: glycosyltransferase [Candidatus Latescibacteria bacterium]|nr:glycosyltransferase [Candidatus Latescibacterota bacterium]